MAVAWHRLLLQVLLLHIYSLITLAAPQSRQLALRRLVPYHHRRQLERHSLLHLVPTAAMETNINNSNTIQDTVDRIIKVLRKGNRSMASNTTNNRIKVNTVNSRTMELRHSLYVASQTTRI